MRRSFRLEELLPFASQDDAPSEAPSHATMGEATAAALAAAGPGRFGDRFPQIDYGAPSADEAGASGQGGTSSSVAATGNRQIDGLLTGLKWSGQAITYTDPDAAADYQSGYRVDINGNGTSAQDEGFGRIGIDQLATVSYALDDAAIGQPPGAHGFSVEGFTNLDISYGTAGSGEGTIRIANTADNAYGYAYYPAGSIYGGDAWLGTALRSPAQGNYAWNNTLHELGHALGLKHGHEVSGPGNTALPTANDSLEFTVMTYRSYVGAGLNGYSNGQWDYPQTYMMLDIAALQYMYGADFQSNAGNTVYTWSPQGGASFINGEIASTPGGNRIFMTIWDGGGNDTYDLSNYATNLRINLDPGLWSTFDTAQVANLGNGRSAQGNVANALLYQGDARSLIENAIGGSGNDNLVGNTAGNRLEGGGGDDFLDSYAGDDTLIGGDGTDTLYGGNDQDLLDGGAGIDTLYGGSGDDLLVGGGGEDNLDGFDGVDTADYQTSEYGIAAALTSGFVFAGLESDHISRVENLAGSQFVDILYGDTGANVIEGLAGNDEISGFGGDDTLIGGDGVDLLTFAFGASGPVKASLALETRQETGMGAMLLLEFEDVRGSGFADSLTGNNLANTVEGGMGDDVLAGLSGNDVLDGGNGADRLIGRRGADTYVVDVAGDRIVERADEGYDTVTAAVSWRLGANVEKLVLSGSADSQGTGNDLANQIEGSAGANRIDGSAGDDRIDGGAGNDVLIGGAGRDTLTGGDGADRFVLYAGDTGAAADTADRITDFVHQQRDRIVLSAIDANNATVADDAFAFIGTDAFAGVAGELRYEIGRNATIIYGDTNGDGAADFALRLDGAVTLVARDFLL